MIEHFFGIIKFFKNPIADKLVTFSEASAALADVGTPAQDVNKVEVTQGFRYSPEIKV